MVHLDSCRPGTLVRPSLPAGRLLWVHMSPAASDTGVVELLAALAYGELTGFARLAGDSELAPTSAARAELGRLAAREFRHYEAL